MANSRLVKKKHCSGQRTLSIIGLFILGVYYHVTRSLKNSLLDYSSSATTTKRLEFVHITKTGGSAIEKIAAENNILWGSCHFRSSTDLKCLEPDVGEYKSLSLDQSITVSSWHLPPKIYQSYLDSSNSSNIYDGASLFVVIRNPYDRALSEYYCPFSGIVRDNRRRRDKPGIEGTQKDPHDKDNMNAWIQKSIKGLEAIDEEYKSFTFKKRLRKHMTRNEFDQVKGEMSKTELKHTKMLKAIDPYLYRQKHYILQAEYVYDIDTGERLIDHVVHYEHIQEEFDSLMKLYNIDMKLPDKENSGTFTSNDSQKLTYLDFNKNTIDMINRYMAKDFEVFGYDMVDSFEGRDYYSLDAKTTTLPDRIMNSR